MTQDGPAGDDPAAGARSPASANRTAVSVPGKLILMGEHSVVYHRPAVVAAVDLRLRVTLEGVASDGLELDLASIGVRERTTWTEVDDYGARARENWREFARQPTAPQFDRVRGVDPAHVVKVGLAEAALACGPRAPRPARVGVRSDVPIGAGFGSSAATAVGVIAAFLAHAGRHADPQTVDRVALEVERRQHGLPSGVDHSTVLRGGMIWALNNPSGAVFLEPVLAVSTLPARIRVFDTGTPTEATGAVVAAVRERLGAADPRETEKLLDRMEDATRAFRDELTAREEDSAAVIEILREFEICLERLGVVPAAVREVVRRVEAEGGAAKISGAGALRGPGAGCLLVYHRDPAATDRWEFLRPFRPCRVTLGAPGLRGELPE